MKLKTKWSLSVLHAKKRKIDIINQNINNVKTNVIVEDQNHCSSLETTGLGSLGKFCNRIGDRTPILFSPPNVQSNISQTKDVRPKMTTAWMLMLILGAFFRISGSINKKYLFLKNIFSIAFIFLKKLIVHLDLYVNIYSLFM